MPTKIILIRHGETDWNCAKRYIGHTDIALNEKGVAQASSLAAKLKGEMINKVYSSSSKRAFGFAKIVFEGRNVEEVAGLKEMSFGILEGMTYVDIMQKYSKIYTAWINDPYNNSIPGAESMADFRERVISSFEKIVAFNKNNTVALVAHAGPIRIMINNTLTAKDFWKDWPEPGSVKMMEIGR